MQRQHIEIEHNIWDSQYKILLTQDNGLLSVAATQLLPLPQSPSSVQPKEWLKSGLRVINKERS